MCYSIQVDKDIKKLALRFDAFYSQNTLDFLSDPKHSGPRIYKNHYAPAIILRKDQREIVPLRFNLLPSFCEKDKYEMYDREKDQMKELSTYNAKIENIESARAYKNLFMRHHCIIPITSFFEWVNQVNPETGKKHKQEIQFTHPKSGSHLFAAGVWDHWENSKQDKVDSINSFSIITTTPRTEVEAAGHHRSPLLLDEQSIDSWINPALLSKSEVYELTKNPFKPELLGSAL
jgi:putative SOS response-associated peptidase YedK